MNYLLFLEWLAIILSCSQLLDIYFDKHSTIWYYTQLLFWQSCALNRFHTDSILCHTVLKTTIIIITIPQKIAHLFLEKYRLSTIY